MMIPFGCRLHGIGFVCDRKAPERENGVRRAYPCGTITDCRGKALGSTAFVRNDAQDARRAQSMQMFSRSPLSLTRCFQSATMISDNSYYFLVGIK